MKHLEENEKPRPKPKERRHVIVEANVKDIKKLDSFIRVMQDVAQDMDLKASVDTTGYLLGADY